MTALRRQLGKRITIFGYTWILRDYPRPELMPTPLFFAAFRMKTLILISPTAFIAQAAGRPARVAIVLFAPRALDINEITLAILSFTKDGDVVVLQESTQPVDFDLVVRRDLQ